MNWINIVSQNESKSVGMSVYRRTYSDEKEHAGVNDSQTITQLF